MLNSSSWGSGPEGAVCLTAPKNKLLMYLPNFTLEQIWWSSKYLRIGVYNWNSDRSSLKIKAKFFCLLSARSFFDMLTFDHCVISGYFNKVCELAVKVVALVKISEIQKGPSSLLDSIAVLPMALLNICFDTQQNCWCKLITVGIPAWQRP